MKNLTITVLLGFCCGFLKSQDLPEMEKNIYCVPGVLMKSPGKGLLVEYGYNPGFQSTFRMGDTESIVQIASRDWWNFKLKIPMVTQPDLKILAGLYHFREDYQFSTITPENNYLRSNLDNQSLKYFRFNISMLKSLGKNNYLALRAETSYNGDYPQLVNFDSRYGIYRIAGVWGIKKTPHTEWGVGLLLSHSFRKNAAYPFLIYNKTFNERWGFETVLPINIKGRYNFNEKNLLLFGGEFVSRVYSIEMNPVVASVVQPAVPPIHHFRRREIQWSLEYNHNVGSWVWLGVQGGYTQYFTTHIESAYDNSERLELSPTGGVFITLSLFVGPPVNCGNYKP